MSDEFYENFENEVNLSYKKIIVNEVYDEIFDEVKTQPPPPPDFNDSLVR